MVLFSSRANIAVVVISKLGNDCANRNQRFALYKNDKRIKYTGRCKGKGLFCLLFMRRLHIGKGIKWKAVVQTIKGAKSAEKTLKIVLTNGDCGGNITKLSRETRVKTK